MSACIITLLNQKQQTFSVWYVKTHLFRYCCFQQRRVVVACYGFAFRISGVAYYCASNPVNATGDCRFGNDRVRMISAGSLQCFLQKLLVSFSFTILGGMVLLCALGRPTNVEELWGDDGNRRIDDVVSLFRFLAPGN